MRYALGIEYNGGEFRGFESQLKERTVQSVLECAVARVADEPIKVICAGRTDSGVHATGQVVHFDSTATRTERSWKLGVSTALPSDVVVRWAREVPEDFHARFKAFKREYRYIIDNSEMRPAMWDKRVGWECRPLQVELMQSAANVLVGEHDFTSFRAAGCQARHPRRTVYDVQLKRCGNYILVDIAANAFLQHMVRNIVGSLIEVGREKRPVAWLEEVLGARDRRLAGATAPPSGLYFCAVHYPSEYDLPVARPPRLLG